MIYHIFVVFIIFSKKYTGFAIILGWIHFATFCPSIPRFGPGVPGVPLITQLELSPPSFHSPQTYPTHSAARHPLGQFLLEYKLTIRSVIETTSYLQLLSDTCKQYL